MVNSKFLKTNVLLETIMSFAYFLYDASGVRIIFGDTALMSKLLFKNFVPSASILKYRKSKYDDAKIRNRQILYSIFNSFCNNSYDNTSIIKTIKREKRG